ncbi:MAG: EamA family transporter [Candidatus Helarchaeota archaeon]
MTTFGIALGILFGLIGTATLHLAKAMERHGIELFDRKKTRAEKGKKPLIWFIGFGLNNTSPLWQFLGTMFAAASVYVSVFGMGLVITLIYSVKILKEKMTKWDWIGSGLIIAGTLFIGFLLFNRPSLENPPVDYNAFMYIMIFSTMIFIVMIIVSYSKKIGISLFFGLVAGACGGIDNVFKHAGFKEGNLWIFFASFGIGFMGFLITQWGFANKADASKLVPAYNSTYIILPIIFESFIILSPFTQITPLQIGGIAIIITGILCMTAIKKWRAPLDSESISSAS